MFRAFISFHQHVYLHLNKCIKVSNTAFGLCSQTYPIVLHMLSARISDRSGNICFCHVVLANIVVTVRKWLTHDSSFLLDRVNRPFSVSDSMFASTDENAVDLLSKFDCI